MTGDCSKYVFQSTTSQQVTVKLHLSFTTFLPNYNQTLTAQQDMQTDKRTLFTVQNSSSSSVASLVQQPPPSLLGRDKRSSGSKAVKDAKAAPPLYTRWS